MSHILISVYIIRPLTKTILGAMEKAGVKDYNIVAGRSPQIEEKSNQGGFLSLLFPGTGIVDEPVDVIQFLVSEDKEDAILKYLISEGQLMMSGRGSIYSENVEVPKAHNLCVVNQVQDVPAVDNVDMLEELSAVCCIVQRGQGQSIAQAALESGVGAPNVTFGVGTGVRDKMGLLRITIPANKELVWMTTSNQDVDMVMNTMINAGRLDQPGKGFIYNFPLRKGVLNMQVSKGNKRSVASSEQIVSALDRLQGGADWRRRDSSGEASDRTYLKNLLDFTLICDEGGADALVPIAMASGAAGATITKMAHVGETTDNNPSLSKSRESCKMIVSSEASKNIISALDSAEAFGEKYHGQIVTHQTQKAFTYLGGAKK